MYEPMMYYDIFCILMYLFCQKALACRLYIKNELFPLGKFYKNKKD